MFAVSPELIARNRRQALQDAEVRFERNRSTGASFAAPPTRKDRNDLKLLRRLYPKFHPDENLEERSKSDRKVPEPDFDDSQFAAFYDELSWYQPFRNELPAPDGNFYPPASKLRPPAEDLLVKVADGAAMLPVSPTAASDPIQAVDPEKIRRRLKVLCPTKYGTKEAAKDLERLLQFGQLRDNNAALTEAQRAEEVRAKARFDAFAASPESIGRRRRKALEDAERQFKLGQLTKEFDAPPLWRKDQNDLERLRWLYPKFHPKENLEERSKSDVSEPDFDDSEFAISHDELSHCLPFLVVREVLSAPDGNFYARHSKLRPAGAADDLLTKVADGPPTSPVSPSNAPPSDPIQSVEPQKLA